MGLLKFNFVYLEQCLCIYYRHLCEDTIYLYLPPPALSCEYGKGSVVHCTEAYNQSRQL